MVRKKSEYDVITAASMVSAPWRLITVKQQMQISCRQYGLVLMVSIAPLLAVNVPTCSGWWSSLKV
jgi:hypothetical protein